jgi:hypothetical protein
MKAIFAFTILLLLPQMIVAQDPTQSSSPQTVNDAKPDYTKGYRGLTWGIHLSTAIDSLRQWNITDIKDVTPYAWKRRGHSRIRIETLEKERSWDEGVDVLRTWEFVDSLFHSVKINRTYHDRMAHTLDMQRIHNGLVSEYGDGSRADQNTIFWEARGLFIALYHKITPVQSSYGVINVGLVPMKNLDLEKHIDR